MSSVLIVDQRDHLLSSPVCSNRMCFTDSPESRSSIKECDADFEMFPHIAFADGFDRCDWS